MYNKQTRMFKQNLLVCVFQSIFETETVDLIARGGVQPLRWSCVCFSLKSQYCFTTALSLLWCIHVQRISIFISTLRVFFAVFIFTSVILDTRASHVIKRLKNYTQFTSKGLGNLTRFNLTSISYSHVVRKSSTIPNISFILLASSSSSALPSLKQQPVFRRNLQNSVQFPLFYKVSITKVNFVGYI